MYIDLFSLCCAVQYYYLCDLDVSAVKAVVNMDKLYDELLVELECPICMTYMAPPIRQCATGHSICEPCRRKLPACPLCQGKFTDSKNISLEALARKMHYPCINNKAGCTERLAWDERENHERDCSYKEKDHKSTIPKHKSYDELFWYKFKSSGGKLFWSIQYIGTSDKANDYYFEIELFKPGQPPGNCVMTSMEAINHFFGDDQLLIYYMRVVEAGDAAEGSRRDRSVSREPAGHDNGRRNDENPGATARKYNFKHYNNAQKKNIKKKPT
ncbi:sina homologue [Carabus blaptoides fortunei]